MREERGKGSHENYDCFLTPKKEIPDICESTRLKIFAIFIIKHVMQAYNFY